MAGYIVFVLAVVLPVVVRCAPPLGPDCWVGNAVNGSWHHCNLGAFCYNEIRANVYSCHSAEECSETFQAEDCDAATTQGFPCCCEWDYCNSPPWTTSSTTQALPQKTCPKGWLTAVSTTGKCYYPYDLPTSYTEAIKVCRELNANSSVTSIRNSFENTEVRDLTRDSNVWIGLEKKSGNWTWEDGSNSTYRHWAPGQPVNSADCVVLNRNAGTWKSEDCNSKLASVCELYL